MSDDKPKSFSDFVSRPSTEEKDKYSLDNFEGPKKESRLSIKWNRIVNTLFGE